MSLPTTPEARKSIPAVTGFLDYFPDAVAMVAYVSKVGNDQHNPGQPIHWSRGKSSDHADALIRHLMERGKLDVDGLPHSAKVAWRAMALLQEELEKHGAELARGARYDEEGLGPVVDFEPISGSIDRMLFEDLSAQRPETTYGGGSTSVSPAPSAHPGRGCSADCFRQVE